jgi:APA family basic amino acid/polyamine antiporter
MAQPRLQYALSRDGLLPEIFGKVDAQGNLWFGTLISGLLMIIIASFVPFDHLNDMISAGILLAFCLTDSSLILMRTESPDTEPFKVERMLLLFNLASLLFGVTMSHFFHFFLGKILMVLSVFQLFKSFGGIWFGCNTAQHFGGKTRRYYGDRCADIEENAYFKTPLLPFVPCFGIFINWYLIGQLEVYGICLLLGFIFAVTLFYFSYSRHHSVGNNGGWNEDGTPRRIDNFTTDHNENFEGSELMNCDYDDNDDENSSSRKMLKSDSQNDISSRTRKRVLPPLE